MSNVAKCGGTLAVAGFGIDADRRTGPTVKSFDWNIERKSDDVCTVTVFGELSEKTRKDTRVSALVRLNTGTKRNETAFVPKGIRVFAVTIVDSPLVMAEDKIKVEKLKVGTDE